MQNMHDVIISDMAMYKGKYKSFSLANIIERRFNKARFLETEEQSLFPEYVFSKEVRKSFSEFDYEPYGAVEITYGANDV